MLSPNDLQTLYQIISDENKTFENTAEEFQKHFEKIDQFKVGITLWFIIKENFLNLVQRLASFYILYDMYRQEEVPTTPFIPLMLECLENSVVNIEKKMLVNLIDFTFIGAKKTIKDFIESSKSSQEDITIPDMEQYWKVHNQTKEKCIQEINDWIRPVLYDNMNNLNIKSPENLPAFDLSKLTPEEISYENFEPNFLTYYPNSTYPFYEDEPMWILPTLKYDFIWDFTMAPIQDTISNILNRPLKNKILSEEQKNFLLDTIKENPNVLKEISFTPDNLMELIEKNDELATEILFRASNHSGFENFLNPLIEKPWTVNSMKVVNKLIQKVDMPEPFIKVYIKHIINNYKNEKRKESKVRVARLIAFFINNLLEHEHITIKLVPPEIKEIFQEKIKDEEFLKLNKKLNTISYNEEENE